MSCNTHSRSSTSPQNRQMEIAKIGKRNDQNTWQGSASKPVIAGRRTPRRSCYSFARKNRKLQSQYGGGPSRHAQALHVNPKARSKSNHLRRHESALLSKSLARNTKISWKHIMQVPHELLFLVDTNQLCCHRNRRNPW
jgi:hypothetical protein